MIYRISLFFLGLLFTFQLNSQTITTIAGNGNYGYVDGNFDIAEFRSPEQLAVDGVGNIYVADSENELIRKISPDGQVSTYAGSGLQGNVNGPKLEARFNFPIGVCFDKGNKYLYITENFTPEIKRIGSDGIVVSVAGSTVGFLDGPLAEAQFGSNVYISIDFEGNLYVADNENNAIRKVDFQTGMVTTLGGDGTIGYQDGPASESKFNNPRGVTVDDQLNVYVADQENHVIRMITPEGIVSTIAGDGVAGFEDGTGENARFNGPKGISIDSLGNLFVADRLNFVVRKIDPSFNVSTIAGIPGISGNIDGDIDNGLVGRAVHVIPLTNNKILVSDWQNEQIRMVTLEETLSSLNILGKIEVNVFPNPSSDVYNFKSEKGISNYTILDNTMKVIRSKDLPNLREFQVDIAQYANGVYYILLENGSAKSQLKLFKI